VLYLDFLAALHERLAPRTYLEIGVAGGHSLARARCRSIGIDPAFSVDQEIIAPVSLLRCTSDEYFARLSADGGRPFGALPVDLAYVDGMHHFEFALRDFIGVERLAGPGSVIAFDDMLPRNADQATRQPRAVDWTGDVFRLQFALPAARADLRLVLVDTEPTGTLLVAGLDPASTVLAEELDDIVREQVVPDPQPIPAEVLTREHALDPTAALALPLWDELLAARNGG
jgi:hypothetical protein